MGEEKPLMQCLFLSYFLKFIFPSFCFDIFFLFSFSPPCTDSAAAALALAAVGDQDLLGGLAALGAEGLNLKERCQSCVISSNNVAVVDLKSTVDSMWIRTAPRPARPGGIGRRVEPTDRMGAPGIIQAVQTDRGLVLAP